MIRKNYHIFAWTNAVIGRVSREDVANAEIIDAAIELFRNGDVAITTNGVTTLSPRVLPFPHDGHGHDDEWVTANFTNATEILAQGYTNWVCAQVGDEEFPSLSLLVEVDETTLHSYFSHDWSGTGGDGSPHQRLAGDGSPRHSWLSVG